MGKIRRPAKGPPEAVGVKDAQGVAVGKMWRPRRPAKAPLKAAGVEDPKGDAVDGEVEASVPGAPVVAAAREKGPLEDGAAVCRIEALHGAPVIATTGQEPEAVGVKDAQGVAMRKMWRPRRPAKAPLKAVRVKDAQGEVEASVLGAPMVTTARGGEKGPLEDETAVCQIEALHGAPVITTTPQEQEEVAVKDPEEVAMRKMWRPRRPAKAPLKARPGAGRRGH
ncbi:uncharacterized protein LOC123397364 [Hordeum vulgare subsp. vulgare]|uniref:uncharacterized protein LOC123397364 n=1 Tax=Hordeum vulgare subsp. vulgare TaxID=112509 RepID=UPI001D1A3D28|nr:uncharacterized protein LOC123397364 [Hordeum vulgare subsp. vulgare]